VPASLPYLAAPGSIKTALERIRDASTPEKVTQDFVQTMLGIKGGTGTAIMPFLKKIGLVASDGTPTDLYKQFRSPTSGKIAAGKALLQGYKPLQELNEYFYRLSDAELTDLIVKATGNDHDSPTTKLTLATLKNLKQYASFEKLESPQEASDSKAELSIQLPPNNDQSFHPHSQRMGLNLAYTINLNLPATSDQAVFNAIFKSLKENLLREE
jgi:hypothetical protein